MVAHVPSKTRKKVEWLFRRAEGALLPEALLGREGAHLDWPDALKRLADEREGVVALGLEGRFDSLTRLVEAGGAPGAAHETDRATYLDQHGIAGVRRFRSGGGARIYCMSVETFPHHINNVYLLCEEQSRILFDCGSGADSSRRDLALGFAVVRAAFGEEVRYEAIDWCVVSHAHFDHFGGANLVKDETSGHLAVHELDARVLSCFGERIVIASKDCDVFWRRAGVPEDDRARLLEMYQAAKSAFRAQDVDRALRDGDTIGPGYKVHHVPGHCPGLMCLQVHDVLLTSDHVLSRITPHQFPQAITPFGGLEHYFHSLAKVRKLEGINYALGGHEEPIWDMRARIDAIALFHRDRLAKVLDHCKKPSTVVDVSQGLFGDQEGYSRILALDEAGAHVEYLHQLGQLAIANLDEVARSRDPVIQYVKR
ncbi:MAG TPA: MBL fold metallo-hydrolase [Polyangiaceae bacterium]|jgi:glyoxylase-like metal-dependent hydrolase (beta-lactamase superfamily II)